MKINIIIILCMISYTSSTQILKHPTSFAKFLSTNITKTFYLENIYYFDKEQDITPFSIYPLNFTNSFTRRFVTEYITVDEYIKSEKLSNFSYSATYIYKYNYTDIGNYFSNLVDVLSHRNKKNQIFVIGLHNNTDRFVLSYYNPSTNFLFPIYTDNKKFVVYINSDNHLVGCTFGKIGIPVCNMRITIKSNNEQIKNFDDLIKIYKQCKSYKSITDMLGYMIENKIKKEVCGHFEIKIENTLYESINSVNQRVVDYCTITKERKIICNNALKSYNLDLIKGSEEITSKYEFDQNTIYFLTVQDSEFIIFNEKVYTLYSRTIDNKYQVYQFFYDNQNITIKTQSSINVFNNRTKTQIQRLKNPQINCKYCDKIKYADKWIPIEKTIHGIKMQIYEYDKKNTNKFIDTGIYVYPEYQKIIPVNNLFFDTSKSMNDFVIDIIKYHQKEKIIEMEQIAIPEKRLKRSVNPISICKSNFNKKYVYTSEEYITILKEDYKCNELKIEPIQEDSYMVCKSRHLNVNECNPIYKEIGFDEYIKCCKIDKSEIITEYEHIIDDIVKLGLTFIL